MLARGLTLSVRAARCTARRNRDPLFAIDRDQCRKRDTWRGDVVVEPVDLTVKTRRIQAAIYSGGAGATGTSTAGNGVDFGGATSNGHAGGGGGGYGRITVRTATGQFTASGGAIVSPMAGNQTVGKR